MYERIKAKVENDVPEKTRAGVLELFDDFRRLDTEIHKRKNIGRAEVDRIVAEGKREEYIQKSRELEELRQAFVMTNSWHYMKNECFVIGIW